MLRRTAIAVLTAACALTAFAALEITPKNVQESLENLDKALAARADAVNRRQAAIDRLTDSLSAGGPEASLVLEIANHYRGFNNDSALHYYSRGMQLADSADRLPFVLGKAALLPLSSQFGQAIDLYSSIDRLSLTPEQLPGYYDAGRQMYSYIAAFPTGDESMRDSNSANALEMQLKLLEVLPENSLEYKFNLGEYYFLTGERGKARSLLEYVIDNTGPDNPLRARAAHHLSTIALRADDENAYIYYLVMSAMADVSAATREVASLQELGNHLYTRGDVNRSYRFLTEALATAVECGAPMRMIESARSLPIIEHAYAEELASKRRTIYFFVAVLILVVIILAITMVVLNRKMQRLRILQQSLRQANQTKDVYISQFLNLCSIYMDKLNQFCKIANRKITTGKVDDLYRLTKSGKFVEDQSKEFYEVFDNAFLHLYPTFVIQVNELLNPDQRIVLKEGELLNTDLRILAFMRLGIEESSRIAQVLNYSLNTIYAYRNRLKARATNRDTFEDDIMKIKSVD